MSEPAHVTIVEHGAAGRPMPGETRSGDRAVVVPRDDGTLLAVIDGLGHGELAADAADAAADALLGAAGCGPSELLRRCHASLRRTRGAAVSVVVVKPTEGLEWLSVGNVMGAVVRPATRRVTRLPNRGGIVGLRLPRLFPSSTDFDPGDLLVLFTDGVAEAVVADLTPSGELPARAAALLEEHALDTDDALLVICRRRRSR